MSIDFRIEGLEHLESQFDRLAETSKKKVMMKALNAGIAPIKKEAKANAPVDKGVLKSQIRSKQMRLTAKPAVGIYVSGKAFYWYFIENGTSKMAAAPFLRPAADSKHEEGVGKFKEKLKAEIDKVMIG
ncbi:HK97-gp10 family putative phage morphogenesis protein [Psychrobacter sp. UBA6291]|uniref:HK97-gp10 family putative phage morphogenesis protein n=1 Tax=Psychrobacter sp. UBA6291 TaxID=1947357 RepID=UPI00257B67A9|nr:HK97-gp10 family putative phage morphogenesis protein [Psychrobacter sp. UBA6291]